MRSAALLVALLISMGLLLVVAVTARADADCPVPPKTALVKSPLGLSPRVREWLVDSIQNIGKPRKAYSALDLTSLRDAKWNFEFGLHRADMWLLNIEQRGSPHTNLIWLLGGTPHRPEEISLISERAAIPSTRCKIAKELWGEWREPGYVFPYREGSMAPVEQKKMITGRTDGRGG